MAGPELGRRARLVAGWCTGLLGLAIPISTALDSILVVGVLGAWVVAVFAHAESALPVTTRFERIALGLFGMLVLSCAYSPVSWAAALSAAFKYAELALVALFAWAVVSAEIRRLALIGFLAGIVANLLISYGSAVSAWDSLPGLRTYPHYPIGFRLSVTHSVLVALAGYTFLLVARDLRGKSASVSLLALALALVCIHNVLFIVIGRTGYVVIAALLAYFAWTITDTRRGILVAGMLLMGLFASAYLGSAAFSTRVQDVAADVTAWMPGGQDETSVGQRIGYYRTTLQIVREHPLTGVGAGGFASTYAEKVRGTRAPVTANPHSDYLMIAAQAGVGALALLLAMYIVAWFDTRLLRTPFERDLARGLVLAIAIAGAFNTALMDHVEGLLFAWGLGVLYAGARGARP